MEDRNAKSLIKQAFYQLWKGTTWPKRELPLLSLEPAQRLSRQQYRAHARATGIVVFIFSTLLIEWFLLLDVVSFTLFVILAILGIRISILSQQRLKKIKIKMKMLHTQEARLLKSTKSADDLLRKFIIIEERIKDDFQWLIQRKVTHLDRRQRLKIMYRYLLLIHKL